MKTILSNIVLSSVIISSCNNIEINNMENNVLGSCETIDTKFYFLSSNQPIVLYTDLLDDSLIDMVYSITYNGVEVPNKNIDIYKGVIHEHSGSSSFINYSNNIQYIIIDPINITSIKNAKVELVATHCNSIVLKKHDNLIQQSRNFELSRVEIDGSDLKWQTIYEKDTMPFIIQLYKWNNWVNIEVIKTKLNDSKYSVKLCDENLLSGKNQLRIIKNDIHDNLWVSHSIEIEMKNLMKVDRMSSNIGEGQVVLNRTCHFRVFNNSGDLILEDINDTINLSKFPKNVYWISYGESTIEFKNYFD